jgi:hypothetical protein
VISAEEAVFWVNDATHQSQEGTSEGDNETWL